MNGQMVFGAGQEQQPIDGIVLYLADPHHWPDCPKRMRDFVLVDGGAIVVAMACHPRGQLVLEVRQLGTGLEVFRVVEGAS